MVVTTNYYIVFSIPSIDSFAFNASKSSMKYYNKSYANGLTKELELHSRLTNYK